MKRSLIIQLLLTISITSFAQEIPKLIPYRKSNKFGYVDQNKKVVIPFKYRDAGIFCSGLAWVKRRNRYTYINEQGEKLTRFKFRKAEDYFGGTAYVIVGGKWKVIDKEGNLSPRVFGWCVAGGSMPSWIVTYFKKNGKYGIVRKCKNEDGLGCDTLIAAKYDSVSKIFGDSFINISINNKWGVVNMEKEIVSPQYDWVSDFCDYDSETYGFITFPAAMVILNKKVGFIDTSGREINKPEYEEASNFKGGLARVILNKKPGYIDLKGNKYFEE